MHPSSAAPDHYSRLRLAGAVVAAALMLTWSAFYLTYPPGKDQGIFLWLGDVVRSGGMPYRDAFEQRGPMPIFFVALIESVFGRNTWGLRLVDLIITYAAMGAVFVLVRRTTASRGAGLVAAAFYFLWYATLEFYDTAQPDGWVGFMLLLTVITLCTGGRVSYARMAAAGLLLGLAALNKPTYLLFAPLPAIALLQGERSPGLAARGLLVAIAAWLLPVVATGLLLWQRGALHDAIDVHIRYTTGAYSRLNEPLLPRMIASLTPLLAQPMVFAIPLAAAGLVQLWKTHRARALLLGWWAVGALINIVVQGKPWLYEWLPTYAPLAVLCGLGVAPLFRSPAAADYTTSDNNVSALGWSALAFALLIAVTGPVRQDARLVRHLVSRTPTGEFQNVVFSEAGIPWGASTTSVQAAADYVRTHSAASARVLFFGEWGADLGYLSGRSAPGRFGWTGPLLSGPSSFRDRYRAEFLKSLAATPPKLLVTDTARCAPPDPDGEWDCLADEFPALRAWIGTDYTPGVNIGRFQMWHRSRDSVGKGGAAAPATMRQN